MPTINTNRLSLVEYSSSKFGYIRSLACLSGVCVNNFEGEDTFEVTLDSISTDSYLSYLQKFTNGFTLFVRLSDNDGMVSPGKTYSLKLKGSDASAFTNVGTVLITKETSFLSNDVLIMHQIDKGTFIIGNRDLEITSLSSSAHASNTAYTVLGIGATTNSSKFLRSDGTWQTPSNTTYATLATNAHTSGTNYVVNGPGNSTNTFLRGDGTWQTPSNTTYGTLSASSHASGTGYLVNGIGATTNSSKFLRSDGTWAEPTNTTYQVLATNAHATSVAYVIKGSGYSGTGAGTKFLREDGTWQTVSGTDELVKQKFTNLDKYFPILLSDNQLSEAGALPTDTTSKAYMAKGVSVNANNGKIYASGFVNPGGGSSTIFWTTDGGTFGFATLATNAHASNASYVIKGSGYSSNPSKFLREDGTWQTVSGGSTYGTLSASSHASGTSYLVNGPGSSTNTFLRGDGSWHAPTNTTYGTFTTAANGLVPKPTSATATTNYVLAGNGTWVTMSGTVAPQAWGRYGYSGTPVQGISMPTSQNRSNFPAVQTSYDGTAVLTSVLFPSKDKELIALPVEISRDGVIYVPVSSKFATMLEEWEYELAKPKK